MEGLLELQWLHLLRTDSQVHDLLAWLACTPACASWAVLDHH